MARLIQRAEGVPDHSDSTQYSPDFGFRYEFRLPRYDPTTIVAIALETVDATTNQVAYLGYSYFPMFLDMKRKEPVLDSSTQTFIFNEGLYQIPIFCQTPIQTPPFTWDACAKLERIPCGTLLIRAAKAATRGT
jgi:hypothetical protein